MTQPLPPHVRVASDYEHGFTLAVDAGVQCLHEEGAVTGAVERLRCWPQPQGGEPFTRGFAEGMEATTERLRNALDVTDALRRLEVLVSEPGLRGA